MTTWTPPPPNRLPVWRKSLRDMHLNTGWAKGVVGSLRLGQATVRPRVYIPPNLTSDLDKVSTKDTDMVADAIAGAVLCVQEAERLAAADLYYASPDMATLAKAASVPAPIEPFAARRAPSPAGLILFAEPIGAYPDPDAEHPDDRDISIVAASWSPWTAETRMPSSPLPVTWYGKNASGVMQQIPPGYEGTWITFYMRPSFDHDDRMPLLPNNELVVAEGRAFDPNPSGDTIDEWLHVLYTAWQLMSQPAAARRAPLAEVTTVPRDRAGRRRDVREGITGSPDVRLVNVHSSHRPRGRLVDTDPSHVPGPREWRHRWRVRPHRRWHCMDPHHHAEGACTHADRVIPKHDKGPPDKPPLITGERVHLWDHQPDDPAPP